MTTLESKKYGLISAIIGDDDEDRVVQIERLYTSEPLVYSSEEIRTTVIQRKRDFDDGKIIAIPHEQMKRRVV